MLSPLPDRMGFARALCFRSLGSDWVGRTDWVNTGLEGTVTANPAAMGPIMLICSIVRLLFILIAACLLALTTTPQAAAYRCRPDSGGRI
jgi:hypothetical protein